MKTSYFLVLISLLLLGFTSATQNPIFLNETYTSGTINVNGQSDLFYVHFESRSVPEIDPLLIWLTGGPGCSSMLALFQENGPLYIDEDLNLYKNPYSWNTRANTLYVDQPVGTGFARVSNSSEYAHNEEEVANDFYVFLLQFYEQHPQYKGRKLYITGESYAGKYIPAIAYKLVQMSNPDMNLQSVAIGNGWVDPSIQYPAEGLFAYENNLISALKYYLYVKPLFFVCSWLVPLPAAKDFCHEAEVAIVGSTGGPSFNIYNIRAPCEGALCYDMTRITKFLNREDVKVALGVPDRTWEDCSNEVYVEIKDYSVNTSPKVAYILENGINVLVYTGTDDYICNYIGGADWTDALEWTHQEAFQNAESTPYLLDGKVVGEQKTADNLTFLKVYNAGHLASMDQPVVTLHMIDQLIGN